VELHAVVKTFASQFFNTGNMVWRQIRAKFDNNVAAVEREGKRFIGHIYNPLGWGNIDGALGDALRWCKAKIIAI
jgi:hypothetical protein